MRTSVLLLAASLAMALLSACDESPPSCFKAMDHYHVVQGGDGPLSEFAQQRRDEDVAWCLDLQAQAEVADCVEMIVDWRKCVYQLGKYMHLSECRWWLWRLEACLEGTDFEEDCDDHLDNDGDGLVDCFDPDCAPLCWGGGYGPPLPQSSPERDVDMLFVIDNSGSMAGEQANLRTNFPALMSSLKNMVGGLPNVHLGVTTTDLGAGMFQLTYCEEVGGDAGALVTGNCINPTGGANYIVDVQPTQCDIIKNTNNTCSSHDCTQANCDHEPTTSLVVDSSTGCPRCRNFTDESLEDVFSCVANLGTGGCGFEQPLEAMRKALDSSNATNTGFIRDNAFLSIILLTDEDDCSASDPQLYDNTQTDIDSTLGPLTSYRCFEFGVTCDINDRTHQSTRHNCVGREDAGAMLHPVSRYTQFLESLKDPQMLVLAAIAGPVTPSITGVGHDVVVGLDDMDQPELQYSCTVADGGAVPTIRLYNLISAFNDEEDLASWAYTSICSADYTPALAGIGDKIKDVLEFHCLPSPLKGCADVGVEFGTPRAPLTCTVNERCLPDCNVGETRHRGTELEYDVWLPPCLEVCDEGYCEGNTIRGNAYADGHPPKRDPNLPVEACWHINYQENCWLSGYAELLVARRIEPPPRTFLGFSCVYIYGDEQLCNDGVDNDEDCLVDADDPCCQNSANCIL